MLKFLQIISGPLKVIGQLVFKSSTALFEKIHNAFSAQISDEKATQFIAIMSKFVDIPKDEELQIRATEGIGARVLEGITVYLDFVFRVIAEPGQIDDPKFQQDVMDGIGSGYPIEVYSGAVILGLILASTKVYLEYNNQIPGDLLISEILRGVDYWSMTFNMESFQIRDDLSRAEYKGLYYWLEIEAKRMSPEKFLELKEKWGVKLPTHTGLKMPPVDRDDQPPMNT